MRKNFGCFYRSFAPISPLTRCFYMLYLSPQGASKQCARVLEQFILIPTVHTVSPHMAFHTSGRKQYARALELFMLGLTAPSLVKSAIVLAIYKKHVLVSLIHLGVCCFDCVCVCVCVPLCWPSTRNTCWCRSST